jgi:hypothetical protein
MMSGGAGAPAAAHASRTIARTRSCGQLLAVALQQPVGARAGLAQHRACRGHAGVCGRLRAADSRQLGRRLRAAAHLERRAVDGQLDTVCAQPVGDGERELGRHERRVHAGATNGARHHLELGIVAWHPAADQVEEAELVHQHELRVRQGPRDALALEHVGEDQRRTVAPDEEERVADRQRHLVAKRGGALGVAVDEKCVHPQRVWSVQSVPDQ